MKKFARILSLLLTAAMLLLVASVSLAQQPEATEAVPVIVSSTPLVVDAGTPIVVEAPSSSTVANALVVVVIAALVLRSAFDAYLNAQANKSAASNVPLGDAVAILDKGIEFGARVLAPGIYKSTATWDDDALEWALGLRGYTVVRRDGSDVIELHRKIAPPVPAAS